jgi:hypothetical protein
VAALIFETSGSWTAVLYGSALLALVAAGLMFALRYASVPSRAPIAIPATAK